jgi:hypothetical protein
MSAERGNACLDAERPATIKHYRRANTKSLNCHGKAINRPVLDGVCNPVRNVKSRYESDLKRYLGVANWGVKFEAILRFIFHPVFVSYR